MTDAHSALAKLRPPDGSDKSVWAARITACWRASVEAILEVGRLLAAAKESLPHGDFRNMLNDSDFPFSPRTAERLMAIAADARLTKATHVSLLPASWSTLYELTRLPDDEFDRKIADGTIRPDMTRRDLAPARPVEPAPGDTKALTIEHDADELALAAAEPAQDPIEPKPEPIDETPLPNGARSIMASRTEPEDSLDYAPTPPWATRALIEKVLPEVGIIDLGTVWEPACGEGHMTGVLEEYTESVFGTDISDYSVSLKAPARWLRLADFLDKNLEYPASDWIITNPPYSRAEDFALLALDRAEIGVAMFVRWQWIETVGRYERLFNPFPPALVCPFAERVPLAMRKYDPNGSTATAYCWVVWLKNVAARDTRLFWIPPGCRKSLAKPGDVERFTAHPVKWLVRGAEDENQDTGPTWFIRSCAVNPNDQPPSIDYEVEGEGWTAESVRADAQKRAAEHPDKTFEVFTINGRSYPLIEEEDRQPQPGKEVENGLSNTKECHDTGGAGEGPPPIDPASADSIPGQCPPIPEILRRTEG